MATWLSTRHGSKFAATLQYWPKLIVRTSRAVCQIRRPVAIGQVEGRLTRRLSIGFAWLQSPNRLPIGCVRDGSALASVAAANRIIPTRFDVP